jgi:hypothetical protein
VGVEPVNLPGKLNGSVRGWPTTLSIEPISVTVRDDGEKLTLGTGAGIERSIAIIVSAIGCCRKCVTCFAESPILQRWTRQRMLLQLNQDLTTCSPALQRWARYRKKL